MCVVDESMMRNLSKFLSCLERLEDEILKILDDLKQCFGSEQDLVCTEQFAIFEVYLYLKNLSMCKTRDARSYNEKKQNLEKASAKLENEESSVHYFLERSGCVILLYCIPKC